MKLEEYVISEYLAIQMKAIGIEQPSLYFFHKGVIYDSSNSKALGSKEDILPAYNSCELGRMLPAEIYIQGITLSLGITKEADDDMWLVGYYTDRQWQCLHYCRDYREVEAKGDMVYWLKANKYSLNI